jgi:hypothetical protein
MYEIGEMRIAKDAPGNPKTDLTEFADLNRSSCGLPG